jgi:hypothetical protein
MMKKVVLPLCACLMSGGPAISQVTECLNKTGTTDLCARARTLEVEAEKEGIFPYPLAEDETYFLMRLTAEGPSLIATIVNTKNMPDVLNDLASRGWSLGQLQNHHQVGARNAVCAGPIFSEFIREGGTFLHVYMTLDGTVYSVVFIHQCEAKG